MKRSALLTVAALIGIIACQEATSPSSQADFAARNSVSNPPPPPIDTGASLTFSATVREAAPKTLIPGVRYSMSVTSCSGGGIPNQLIIPVRYFFDPATKSGWLHMTNAPFDSSITADANGMVRMRTLSDGTPVFDGKGKVQIVIDGCPVIVNLVSVSPYPQTAFGDCTTTPTIDAAPGFCFHVHFTDVTVNGVPIGGADMNTASECVEGDTRPECTPSFQNVIE